MMGTETVPETSVSICNQLTRLCAREDFIEFSRRESLKLYIRKISLLTDVINPFPLCAKKLSLPLVAILL
jgi:hypothetical protein